MIINSIADGGIFEFEICYVAFALFCFLEYNVRKQQKRGIIIKHLETPKQLVDEMIEKGIKFELCSESDAINFLTNNSYYKKVSSYQNNFHTTINQQKKKIFSDLDFAYLIELSRLDMEFRFLVMRMCLNFEHTLKIVVLNKCLDKGEDGYKIIEEYISEFPKEMENVKIHKRNVYCHDLIEANETKMPIWVFLEVISFGGLRKLCAFMKRKGYFEDWEIDVFSTIAALRNAAAHSHCLFSQLYRSNRQTPINKVRSYIAKIDGIGKLEKKNNLKSVCVKDFVTLLYAFEYYVRSEGIISHTKQELNFLFNERMLRHKEYFQNCTTVKNAYCFVKKVVDNWIKE
mgnify:CR=1 FL=1